MNDFGWIPVTERLPNPYEVVVITSSTNLVLAAFMTLDQRWIAFVEDRSCVGDKAIAWMPLPEPYKEEDIMEGYKLRMIDEYRELKEKYDKLHRMLVQYDAGKLDFTPTCPIDLLRKQASIMGQYLYVLETRSVIEGVNLNVEGSESDEATDT